MSPTGTQSIDRAFSLLQLIGHYHPKGLHIETIVRLSALNRTTVHRILRALLQRQLIYRDNDRPYYYLGLETISLGMAAMADPPLLHPFQELLDELVHKTGASVFFSIRLGHYAHCLYYKRGQMSRPTFARYYGHTQLLGMGISSFSLLAHLPNEEIKVHYERYQSAYKDYRLSFKRMMEWVHLARQSGYAYINAQHVGGVGTRLPYGSSSDACISLVIPDYLDKQRAEQYAHLIFDVIKKAPV